MAKKYEFNQQAATFKLREPINEGRVMFTIDDEKVDSLFNSQFEADVDYIHDGPDVYYITDQNDLERFVDYIESLGLDGDAIQTQEYFKEEGTVTGGEAYLPAMNASSKKRNPFKEDVLSGYKQDKNFRPGHTKDRGGFQYKELWELDETYTPSTTNAEELARIEDLLAKAHQDKAYSVMSSYEFRIKALRLLVALENKYNTTLPLFKFGMMVSDYLTKYFPKFKGKFGPYNQNWKAVKDHIEQLLSQNQNISEHKYIVLQEMNDIIDEVFSYEDYQKVLKIIDKIKYTNTRLYNVILDMISDIYPHDYEEVEAQMRMNEVVDMNELEIELKRIKKENPGKKVTYFFTKDEPKGYKIRIQDPKDRNLKENYSKFRNETKTRTKPEQFHQAVKSVKRKVEEINKLYEYMERLKNELSESSDGLKYKKYTENAILKIKEAVKALHLKTKKLK